MIKILLILFLPLLILKESGSSATGKYNSIDTGPRKILGLKRNAAAPAVDLTPKLFIQDGNSLGFGYLDCSPTLSCNIGDQVFNGLNTHSTFTYRYTSVSGRGTTGMISDLPANVYPYFDDDDYSKIIVATIEGTNEIHTHNDGAAAYGYMMDYVNALLAEDSRVCVMVYMMPNCDPAFASETERGVFNGLLSGTTQTSRFKVVDISSEPLLNDATAYLNTTYYYDGIHLTPAGYVLLASYGLSKAQTF